MHVDFAYYSGTYAGSLLTEDDFAAPVREAEAYIRYLTYVNGDIFADIRHEEAVKSAVCAAAEAWYQAVQEQEQGGNLKSESKDGLSISFVTARKDGESVDDYARRRMYQAVRIRLFPTGWLSRKVGCGCDNECESRDCL